MEQLSRPSLTRVLAIAIMGLAALPATLLAQGYPNGAGMTLRDRLGALVDRGRERYSDMQRQAMARMAAAPRIGSCVDRQRRFASIAPEAARLAEMSEAVYRGDGDQMAARGLVEASLGPGRIGFQAERGDFYAEAREMPGGRTLFIAFRGTRTGARGDIATDIGNFAGMETPYYAWARDLAAQLIASHPGWRVVTTGHSLGGGLALAAALANPPVEAVVFDPAGLSNRAWSTASEANRRRMLNGSSAFVAVTPQAMDPVSAGSITGLSVIPARIYAIPVDDNGSPVERHRIAAIEAGLGRAIADPVATCSFDVGNLGITK